VSSVVGTVNRSLLGFIWFLLALALAAAAGAWWLGPGVVNLVLDDERRSEPYYLLHLGEQSVPGSEYAAQFTSLVQAEDGELLWRGSLERVLEGRLQDEWPDLMLFRMARGGDLIQTVTSPEYRRIISGRRLMLLGVPEPPADLTGTGTLVLWLQQTDDGDQAAASAALAQVAQNLSNFSGAVMWDSPVDLITGQGQWDHLAVLAFPDAATAQNWFREPASLTERTLAGKNLQHQTWLLMNAGYLR